MAVVFFFPASQRISLKHFILSFRWLDEMLSDLSHRLGIKVHGINSLVLLKWIT